MSTAATCKHRHHAVRCGSCGLALYSFGADDAPQAALRRERDDALAEASAIRSCLGKGIQGLLADYSGEPVPALDDHVGLDQALRRMVEQLVVEAGGSVEGRRGGAAEAEGDASTTSGAGAIPRVNPRPSTSVDDMDRARLGGSYDGGER